MNVRPPHSPRDASPRRPRPPATAGRWNRCSRCDGKTTRFTKACAASAGDVERRWSERRDHANDQDHADSTSAGRFSPLGPPGIHPFPEGRSRVNQIEQRNGKWPDNCRNPYPTRLPPPPLMRKVTNNKHRRQERRKNQNNRVHAGLLLSAKHPTGGRTARLPIKRQ